MGTRDQLFPRLIACLMFALAALTSAPVVFAQSDSADARAVTLRPLSLVKVTDLDFGNLIPGPAGGTAVVSPTGVLTETGSVVAAGGSPNNAEFRGYGSQGRFVFVSTASSTYTLLRSGGGGAMTLRQLTLQADNLTPRFFPGLFTINSTDVITLRIGGTLDVGANQPAGVYEATFPITMNYF